MFGSCLRFFDNGSPANPFVPLDWRETFPLRMYERI